MTVKKLIAVSALLFAALFTLPLTVKGKKPPEPTFEPVGVQQTAVPDEAPPQIEPESTAVQIEIAEELPVEAPPQDSVDAAATIRLMTNGEVVELSLYEYLVGVTAAEMPVLFGEEALKAQSVAARTCTLYRRLCEPSAAHPEADVCDDVMCCEAYCDEARRRERWGDAFEEYEAKIRRAVAATDGLCLTWEDEPIFAAFHSSSNGFTEASGNVWLRSLPYLVSVYSPETEDIVPDYHSETVVAYEEFKETVLARYPSASLAGAPQSWIAEPERTLSGRIKTVNIGGVSLTGTQLRQLFGLRSAAIEISADESAFTFAVTGYGHGVGMSQYGANRLAAAGSDFKEILSWYYTGATLTNMKTLPP